VDEAHGKVSLPMAASVTPGCHCLNAQQINWLFDGYDLTLNQKKPKLAHQKSLVFPYC